MQFRWMDQDGEIKSRCMGLGKKLLGVFSFINKNAQSGTFNSSVKYY